MAKKSQEKEEYKAGHKEEHKAEHARHEAQELTHEETSFVKNTHIALLITAVAILIAAQLMAATAMAATGGAGTYSIGSLNLEYGSKKTLKPMPLAAGEEPVIAGYRTKVKSMPTISELELKPSAGDVTQDLLNNLVPSGTPWYGADAGVSFDDPIAAQNTWAKYRSLKLSPELEQRWNTIVNSFTCDYCCGSPQNIRVPLRAWRSGF